MNLSEMIAPDTPSSVARDIVRVAGGFVVRGALYSVAVAALCFASVIRVNQFWVSPGTSVIALIALAVIAFVAARALHKNARHQGDGIGFCKPHRKVSA